ncbi:MAG: glycerol-3-phosphate 1-O-acyltransferase PlsY [Phycisphaerae bacterium]
MQFAFLVIFAYLLGSVPFALIIAKAYGKDIRTIGSGNIGATNLSRAIGKKWGYACFLLDVLKGLVPMLIAGGFISSHPETLELFLWLVVGCAAILGHVFSIYIGFKGGKGVATSFGVAMGLWPYFTICAAIAMVTWILFVLIFRYISLASVIAAIVFSAALVILTIVLENWKWVNLWPLILAAAAITLMIIFRHRENIRRIISGTEAKVLKKD